MLPPARVRDRDGRAVAFDADRVCQALFAATAALGRPDALRARELGDSAVHFLAQEYEGQEPTTAQVAEVVAKVLRQLGHAELARAYEARGGADAAGPSPYSPDLADAVARGLLHLDDADRLAAGVLGPPGHEAPPAARLVSDGPDGRADAVNLNTAAPPSHAVALAQGPLFAAAAAPAAEPRGARAEAMLDQLGPTRVTWHVSEDDFTDPGRDRLARAAARLGVTFAFDRPRRPVALGCGLDRDHPAALLVAGLGLPALAAQPGLLADRDRFLHRLGSLVRLALSAAVQKRARLRQRLGEAVTRGFLLDRARLVAVPVGLDEVVRQFTSWGLANGGESLELGAAIVRRIREVLRDGGRALGLTACVDGPSSFALAGRPERPTIAGLTPWDEGASVASQLRAAGALHAGEAGVAAVFAPPGAAASVLEQAWRQGDIARLRLLSAAAVPPGAS